MRANSLLIENGERTEVSADAAYLSHENCNMVGEAGGPPYILFKSNTTAAAGGLMAKMFHFYNLNRDEYLSHYHKRSNVESTFSMIKAKFRDSVRARSDSGMVNEVLAKIICHNVCCLIHSIFELGIAPTFWMYAGVCVVGLLWGYYFIPETKGKSLEQIEEHWREGGNARNL